MSERAQALEAALRALRNECHAIKSMSYDEIKASAGYTNLKCWMDRMDEADALLAVPPPPPVGSPTTERPTKPSREVPNLMKALLKSLEPPVVEPTPEPLTEKPPHYCVWRETPTSTMWPSCVGQIDPLPGYRFCPYCGHPLTVER